MPVTNVKNVGRSTKISFLIKTVAPRLSISGKSFSCGHGLSHNYPDILNDIEVLCVKRRIRGVFVAIANEALVVNTVEPSIGTALGGSPVYVREMMVRWRIDVIDNHRHE